MEQQQGAYEAARYGDSVQRQLASMRGQFLSSGVSVSTGSPLAIIEDSAAEASLDEQAIRYGATLRQGNALFEAQQARQNASTARTGSIIGAISPFVNAASQASQNRRMATMINNPFTRMG